MRYVLILSLTTVLLAGCASYSRVAILQNPETKQTVDCRAKPSALGDFNKQVDTCVQTYQKAGYKLVSDSANQ